VDSAGKKDKMRYKGYGSTRNCLRYEHSGKTYKIYVSYEERIFLLIARDSLKFKRLYKARTSVERLNGRLDRDFMFEDHCLRGRTKTKLMVSVSFIVMNAMALGKIKELTPGTGDPYEDRTAECGLAGSESYKKRYKKGDYPQFSNAGVDCFCLNRVLACD
jgi:hypothetical protein